MNKSREKVGEWGGPRPPSPLSELPVLGFGFTTENFNARSAPENFFFCFRDRGSLYLYIPQKGNSFNKGVGVWVGTGLRCSSARMWGRACARPAVNNRLRTACPWPPSPLQAPRQAQIHAEVATHQPWRCETPASCQTCPCRGRSWCRVCEIGIEKGVWGCTGALCLGRGCEGVKSRAGSQGRDSCWPASLP